MALSHDPDDFSFLSIEETPSIKVNTIQERPATNKSNGSTKPALTDSLSSKFGDLPPEIRTMIWKCAASPLAQPRTVEVHTIKLAVRYRYAEDENQSYTNECAIEHLRSFTPSSPLLQACPESASEAWKHYDQTLHLGNKYCPDMVAFNLHRDRVYFTRNTLKTWMFFWKRCSQRNLEFPLNEEDSAGLVLRTNLRHVIFDADLLLSCEIALPGGTVGTGNSENINALGRGLFSFQRLEEIILVISEVAAMVFVDELCRIEEKGDVDFTGGGYQIAPALQLENESLSDSSPYATVQEFETQAGFSSLKLVEPKSNSIAAFVLQEAKSFLIGHLNDYFNKFFDLGGGAM